MRRSFTGRQAQGRAVQAGRTACAPRYLDGGKRVRIAVWLDKRAHVSLLEGLLVKCDYSGTGPQYPRDPCQQPWADPVSFLVSLGAHSV